MQNTFVYIMRLWYFQSLLSCAYLGEFLSDSTLLQKILFCFACWLQTLNFHFILVPFSVVCKLNALCCQIACVLLTKNFDKIHKNRVATVFIMFERNKQKISDFLSPLKYSYLYLASIRRAEELQWKNESWNSVPN